MGKNFKEIEISFLCDEITPEKYLELNRRLEMLSLDEIFGSDTQMTLEIKIEYSEDFNEKVLENYIESLEEVNEIERNEECDDHECVFNFEGQCLKDDEEPEEPEDFLATENENCQCPLCQNEKLTEVLDDLENDYMELQQILKEKDNLIETLNKQLNKSKNIDVKSELIKLLQDGTVIASNSAGPVNFKIY